MTSLYKWVDVIAYKKHHIVLQSSKHEEKPFSHGFNFVFIVHLLGQYCLENVAKSGEIGKKDIQAESPYRALIYRREVQIFCTL